MVIQPNQLYIETGDTCPSKYESLKMFFVHCFPTGAESPLGKCSFLKKEWTHTEGGFAISDTRIVRTLYTISSQFRLKMINIITEFGRMRSGTFSVPRPVIYIDVTPAEGSLIELTGLKGFGKLMVYGSIDYKASYVNSEKEMQSLHNLKYVKELGAPDQKRKVMW